MNLSLLPLLDFRTTISLSLHFASLFFFSLPKMKFRFYILFVGYVRMVHAKYDIKRTNVHTEAEFGVSISIFPRLLFSFLPPLFSSSYSLNPVGEKCLKVMSK